MLLPPPRPFPLSSPARPPHTAVHVASVDEVTPGTMKMVDVGERIVLLVNVQGSIHAVQGLCTHEDAPLDEGFLLGDDLTCGLHGSRFSVSTGEVLDLPAVEPLQRHAVRVEAGQIWVDPEPFDVERGGTS